MNNPGGSIQSRAQSKQDSLKINKFSFIQAVSAETVSGKYITYTPPRIVKTKKRWYVEYYFRVPAELKDQYKHKWERQRVFENINRFKTDEYANELKNAVEKMLQQGYSPFKVELEDLYIPEKKVEWSLNYALDQFLDYCREKGLRKKTIQSYQITVNFLKEYFLTGNKIYQPVSSFEKSDIKAYLKNMKKRKEWGNYTYNNYLTSIRTIFNWLVKEEKIEKSPASGIEELPVNITSHRYYPDAVAKKLKEMIFKQDKILYNFIQFIYYTATRPKSEARLLQVKHVLFDRELLFVPAGISKNKKDDYVPMSKDLIEMLKHMGIDEAPKEDYIFGLHGHDKKPVSQNYFAARFKPYKDKLNLDETYSLYGFKHLRAIHLAQDGASPYDIMRIFRHSSLDVTMTYLRDLGIADQHDVLKKTRKF